MLVMMVIMRVMMTMVVLLCYDDVGDGDDDIAW